MNGLKNTLKFQYRIHMNITPQCIINVQMDVLTMFRDMPFYAMTEPLFKDIPHDVMELILIFIMKIDSQH
jgi:hypothetical protein